MAIPFIRALIHLPEIGSTSDEARRLLIEGEIALPLLVRAERQTAGRGRGTNTWWSDEGSLLFTVGLDPRAHGLALEQSPRVALVSALVLVDALEAWLPRGALGVRWPNDVEASGRKLAGILPEWINSPAGPRLAIGIGINVNTQLNDAPEPVRRMATTLAELLGHPIQPELILEAVLARLGPALDDLAAGSANQSRRWSALDSLRDQPVRIRLADHLLQVTARGINELGALIVEHPDGQHQSLFGGQVLREPERRS